MRGIFYSGIKINWRLFWSYFEWYQSFMNICWKVPLSRIQYFWSQSTSVGSEDIESIYSSLRPPRRHDIPSLWSPSTIHHMFTTRPYTITPYLPVLTVHTCFACAAYSTIPDEVSDDAGSCGPESVWLFCLGKYFCNVHFLVVWGSFSEKSKYDVSKCSLLSYRSANIGTGCNSKIGMGEGNPRSLVVNRTWFSVSLKMCFTFLPFSSMSVEYRTGHFW